MKAYIAREERYPVYRVYSPGEEPDDALPVDIPGEFLLNQRFHDLTQEVLAEYYEDAEEHMKALYDSGMTTVHLVPQRHEAFMSCCGLSPYEVPLGNHFTTDPERVTCTGDYPDCSGHPSYAPQPGENIQKVYPVSHGPRCRGHWSRSYSMGPRTPWIAIRRDGRDVVPVLEKYL